MTIKLAKSYFGFNVYRGDRSVFGFAGVRGEKHLFHYTRTTVGFVLVVLGFGVLVTY